MHFIEAQRNPPEISDDSVQTPVHPGSETLRRAIRRNIVSFPSQIPPLLKRPLADMQWRIVLLFFVRGWSAAKIAARFNIPRHGIWKILNGWSVRALALGYVQVIDPVAFAACCRADVEYITNREAAERRPDEVLPTHKGVPKPFPDVIRAAGAGSPLETAETRPEGWPVDLPGATADPIAAIDAAIAHCEEWRDELWARTATLLRELKTLAAELELRRLSVPEHLPSALRVREEERVSHAVA
jgi:hypothetical protein